MRRTFIVVAAILIWESVAVAATLPHSYRLKPGSKCRSGYVRKIRVENRHKKLWCVEKPRIATTIHILSSPDYSGGPGYDQSDSVSAEVAYNRDNNTLDGVPLRFAVVNDVTGKTVATFPGVANIYTSCSIVVSLNSGGKTETLTGQGVGTDPGCRLSPVTVPAHSASLLVTFAGTAKYGPSSGTGPL
jgi:hypothetical protein